MLNQEIEIHDSILEKILRLRDDASLYFSLVYIHKSEGLPGRDFGTVWVQPAILHIAHARISGAFSKLPVRLADGTISLGETSLNNVIPVPLLHEDSFKLRLEAFEERKEIVTFEGSRAELELIGEAQYLEEFRP